MTAVRRALAPLPDSDGRRRWLRFDDPRESIVVWHLAEVRAALDRIEQAVERGRWAVGFVSYDAGPAFDPAVVSQRDTGTPLLAFGIFENPSPDDLADGADFSAEDWAPSMGRSEYEAGVRTVKEHIARGDTYQVNLTQRLRTRFEGDPLGLFRAMARSQQGEHCVYLDLGTHALCSASPELFFGRAGKHRLVSKPMKGTRPRATDPAEDRALAEELATSEKDRAENTMIVDMMRNDFGRIARIGSIDVPDLHVIESFPTVHQMVSTVTADADASITEIFDACFPPASITGAPKVSTTRIIADLESDARGVYTGAAGVLAPDGSAEFNVAIRTAWIDRVAGTATYGVGGGIVWDSDPTDEWLETRTKTKVLESAPGPFDLFETMLFLPGLGLSLLERHLDRIESSAQRFGFVFDRPAVEARLGQIDSPTPLRVKLTLRPDGELVLGSSPIDPFEGATWTVAVDSQPVCGGDVFLRHKTTRRAVYDSARSRHPGVRDVILWNEQGELTETTVGNLVLDIDGELVTPRLCSGLLPGTFRADLLDHDKVVERVLRLQDLERANEVFMINSVRGWVLLDVEN